MAANALPMALGAAFAGAAAYVAFLRPAEPVLARGDSNAGATKKGPLVRRHSSGDHVFLPTRGETAAKKLAGRGGIQEGQVADSEGLSLPSVHEASLANK